MIDLLKIHTSDIDLIKKLNESPLLIWSEKKEQVASDRETIRYKERKTFEGIWFHFMERSLDIIFKPHYFYNNDLHNANDFPTDCCISVISHFLTLFDLWERAGRLFIVNIEFGVNIVPPIPVKDLVAGLEYHGKNLFRSDTGLSYSKKSSYESRNGNLSGYKIIKAYAKGLQFPEYCNPETFRWEVKSKQAKFIRLLGVNTIVDLLQTEPYIQMGQYLLNEWGNVLLLGVPQASKMLSPKENEQLNQYFSGMRWFHILQKSRNRFQFHKKRFNELMQKAGNDTAIIIDKTLREKVAELT